jgi:crotonobetainyl-CoA:carnitine CoA-transferase CaiB-like acyl-CoA transferase
MAGPCSGLTVLDFSWGMPGALATAVLADFGAEVIKVEPPTGDPYRSHPSWLAWNRGKKGVVLDLQTQDGREQAQSLARRADVLVESFRPGETESLAISYEELSKSNPYLVYCSITGFGQKGRLKNLKDYEGIVAAKTGRMFGFAGQTSRPGPVYAAVHTASWAASQAAVRGVLAALRIRDQLGRGQWVQTSLMQGMIPYDGRLLNGFFHRKDPERFPADPLANLLRLPTLQYIPVRTKDGRWMQHANIMDRLFRTFLQAVGLGWALDDERFKHAPNMTEENREVLREVILERMQEKTLDEWMDLYVEDGNIAAEPFLYTVEGMQHAQFVHNNHVVEINDPRVGPMKIVGVLADLSDTPGKVGGPAPNLGQHTAEVLAGMSERAPVAVAGASNGHSNGHTPRHPLSDITVLDFSTVIAGPYGAAMIADLGARVIKVDATPEREQRFIGTRSGPNIGGLKTYAGKECIQVDLQTEEGQEIVHKLIGKADVLLHNFRPGVPDRLGIDYETCRSINPRLIHVYVGAYGATGPHSRRPGAHPIPGALFGGALRQAGLSMPPPPGQPMDMEEIKEVSRWLMRANEGNPDPNSSQGVGTAIMLGLLARERTGQGQAVQVTMMCANAWANHDEAYDFVGRHPNPIPDPECYGLNALYRLYQAKEGWVFLACLFEDEWVSLCDTLGRIDLVEDPRFAHAARQAHDKELVDQLSQIFATRPATEWEELLTAKDVACVRADVSAEEFFLDEPHARDNDLAVEVESPRFGKHLRHGSIVHFSETPPRILSGSYRGQHTRAVLAELGYRDEQIDDYRKSHIVDWEEVSPLFMDEQAN